MEPEREIARVHGLGRGSILGFSLIVTDRKIVGIDTRKVSVRLWLSMMLGLGLGGILIVLVLFSGLWAVVVQNQSTLVFRRHVLACSLTPHSDGCASAPFSSKKNTADCSFNSSSSQGRYYSHRSP